jgi:hypothetical protein
MRDERTTVSGERSCGSRDGRYPKATPSRMRRQRACETMAQDLTEEDHMVLGIVILGILAVVVGWWLRGVYDLRRDLRREVVDQNDERDAGPTPRRIFTISIVGRSGSPTTRREP